MPSTSGQVPILQSQGRHRIRSQLERPDSHLHIAVTLQLRNRVFDQEAERIHVSKDIYFDAHVIDLPTHTHLRVHTGKYR